MTPGISSLYFEESVGKILKSNKPLAAVKVEYDLCVIEEALCIEALNECVCEWVNATCPGKHLSMMVKEESC